MTEILDSVKKFAEKAAKAAQQVMSDKPPVPVESGGIAEKLPRPGAVISPPPLNPGSELKGQ
ncbi:MAG: hypothetical protein WBV94_02665 [Blastocatellia bacterium]